MKTSLDHLPEGKRAELSLVLEVLFREFEDVIKRKAAGRLQGRILKVILFGSYARGDWVDDPVGGYKSDYDLLIVVNHDDFADVTDYWMDAEAHLEQAFDIAHTLTAPAHFIVHSLADVNRQLTRGRPFFTQILDDGVLLYEAPDHPFSRPASYRPPRPFLRPRPTSRSGFRAHPRSWKARSSSSRRRATTKPPSSCIKPPSATTTASC